MLEQGKIDSRQAIMLMISMILPTAIITIPAITAQAAKQDAWVSMIIATLIGLLIAWMVVSLSLRFPGKTLFQYAEVILGKVAGKIIGFIYIWLFFLYIGSGVVREFGFFLVTAIMPETPIMVFQIAVVAIAAYAVRNGLEVLSRFNQLFLPLLLGLVLIIFILMTKDMKIVNLLPVFDNGLSPILKGAVTPTMWFGEIITLSVIIPYLNRPKEVHRVATLSILLTSLFLTTSILTTLLIFGPSMTGHWVFPAYNTVRVISVANFLERLESLVIVVWVIGGIAKIGVFYYAAVLGSAQWFGLKDYRPLVIPVGVILVALSILLWGENTVEMLHFIARVYVPFSLIVLEVGIPLGLLIVALVRAKGGRNS